MEQFLKDLICAFLMWISIDYKREEPIKLFTLDWFILLFIIITTILVLTNKI